MRKHRIVVELEAPEDASDEEVITSVELMLSIGKADAQDTLEDDDNEDPDSDAELSANIEIVSVTGE